MNFAYTLHEWHKVYSYMLCVWSYEVECKYIQDQQDVNLGESGRGFATSLQLPIL